MGKMLFINDLPGFLTKKFFPQQGFTTPRLRIAGEDKMAAETSVGSRTIEKAILSSAEGTYALGERS